MDVVLKIIEPLPVASDWITIPGVALLVTVPLTLKAFPGATVTEALFLMVMLWQVAGVAGSSLIIGRFDTTGIVTSSDGPGTALELQLVDVPQLVLVAPVQEGVTVRVEVLVLVHPAPEVNVAV